MDKLLPIILRLVGLGLILVGLVAAYYAPLEIFVFYLFSEGGQFHYAGFGMGSFWFAALVVLNMGYYIIAALCIPVGVGHLMLRRWALTLTQLYIWFWLAGGLLIIGNAIALAPSVFRLELARDVLLARLAITSAAALLTLVALPVLALAVYRSERVRSVFTQHDANRYWTERYPFPLLALLLLFFIMLIVMHIAIFFQGLFPMFGQILLGRQSAYVVALCILILGILMFGLIRLKMWAWWGSMVYVALLTVSTAWSFSRYRVYDVILMLNLPAYEMDFLGKWALFQDFRLVGALAIPLLIALALVVYSRRYFG